MNDSIVNTLAELRQCLDQLEMALVGAGELPALHEARVLIRLDDATRLVEGLIDQTQPYCQAGAKGR
jgi:hypothetical protein